VEDIDVNSWDSSFFQTIPTFTRLQVIDWTKGPLWSNSLSACDRVKW
jgi:hypothetical protein